MAAIVSKNMGESILSGAENTLFYQIAERDASAGEGGMCGKTAKMQDGGHRKPSRRQKTRGGFQFGQILEKNEMNSDSQYDHYKQ